MPFQCESIRSALATFFLGIAVLVWGVLPADRGGFGWYIVEIAALFVALNLVLCGCAAYRTQLFLYVKACGREELGDGDPLGRHGCAPSVQLAVKG